MKFQTGDKVRVVADKKRLEMCDVWDNASTGETGIIIDIDPDEELAYAVQFNDNYWYLAEYDLELVEQPQEPKQFTTTFVGHPDGGLGIVATMSCDEPIRKFATGATRDTVKGKLDYVKALSPIVLRRYVQYLDKHRLQSDGSYRDFDNWKKGIPQETYHSSSGRHFFDAWLLTEGYTAEDNHGPVELEDTLCGQLFNIMGRLHEILNGKVDRTTPTEGGY